MFVQKMLPLITHVTLPELKAKIWHKVLEKTEKIYIFKVALQIYVCMSTWKLFFYFCTFCMHKNKISFSWSSVQSMAWIKETLAQYQRKSDSTCGEKERKRKKISEILAWTNRVSVFASKSPKCLLKNK